MGNRFVWNELMTSDLKGAQEFYGQLFDWEIMPIPQAPHPYLGIETGEQPGGGMMQVPQPGMPVGWMIYVDVDDIAAYTQKARDLGATIVMPVTEIPGIGWFSVIQDPQGAVFNLFQMAEGAEQEK